jgi:hypothetical protein
LCSAAVVIFSWFHFLFTLVVCISTGSVALLLKLAQANFETGQQAQNISSFWRAADRCLLITRCSSYARRCLDKRSLPTGTHEATVGSDDLTQSPSKASPTPSSPTGTVTTAVRRAATSHNTTSSPLQAAHTVLGLLPLLLLFTTVFLTACTRITKTHTNVTTLHVQFNSFLTFREDRSSIHPHIQPDSKLITSC